MERFLMKTLIQWKEQGHKKPLLLLGMRQVGKTWLLKEFGKAQFAHTLYVNLEEEPCYRQIFETETDTRRIAEGLCRLAGHTFLPKNTLIILDDIDACPAALRVLSAFGKRIGTCALACAGRQLENAREKKLFRENEVFLQTLEPMNFTEFLLAAGQRTLAEYLQGVSVKTPVLNVFWTPLMEKLEQYFLTGGMPGAVQCWLDTGDAQQVRQALYHILLLCERDFSHYPEWKELPKILSIWESLPQQLTKKNRKFLYCAVKDGARAREYEDALYWLVQSHFAKQLPCLADPLDLRKKKSGSFQIYAPDVGILQRLLQITTPQEETIPLFQRHNGALTKNFLVQALLPRFEGGLSYWAQVNPVYEVDFLVWKANRLIPMELELTDSPVLKNLKKYHEKFGQAEDLQVCFSFANLHMEKHTLYIPIFLADEANRLLDEALQG